MKIPILPVGFLVALASSTPTNSSAIESNLEVPPGQPLFLDFNPNIIKPHCGGTYQTQVSTYYIEGGDPAGVGIATAKFLNLLGGPKGKKDVNVTFVCLGQPIEAGSYDNNKIKVVFFAAPNTPVDVTQGGRQDIPATMQVTHVPSNFIVTMPAKLVAIWDSKKQTTAFDTFIC